MGPYRSYFVYLGVLIAFVVIYNVAAQETVVETTPTTSNSTSATSTSTLTATSPTTPGMTATEEMTTATSTSTATTPTASATTAFLEETTTATSTTPTTSTKSTTTIASAAERAVAAGECPKVTRRDGNGELILELDNNENCEIVVNLNKKRKMKKTKQTKAKKAKKLNGAKKAKRLAKRVEFREKLEDGEPCAEMTATKAGRHQIVIETVAEKCEILVEKRKKAKGLPVVKTRTVKTIS